MSAVDRLPDLLERLIPSRAARAFSFAILAGTFFQALNATVRHLTMELPPLEVSWGRWIAGLLFTAPFLLRGGLASLRTSQLRRHLLRGVFHTAGYDLWYWAIAAIPLAQAAALGFTGPIFVTLGAALFLGEHVRWRRWLAVTLGFGGVLLIVQPWTANLNSFALIMLAAVPLTAASNLVAKVISAHEKPEVVVFWQSALAVVFFAPLGLWDFRLPSPGQFGWIAVAGITGTMGYFLMTWAFRLADISSVQTVGYLGIVWATLFDLTLFGHTADTWTFVGAAAIVVATSYIAHRESVGAQSKSVPLTH
ncbi:MAG: DMT family transporter [Reyranellaceae bacterium]